MFSFLASILACMGRRTACFGERKTEPKISGKSSRKWMGSDIECEEKGLADGGRSSLEEQPVYSMARNY